MYGHGDDDSMWDGLACPPLEDYMFNFDTSFAPDVLDDLLLEIGEEDDEDIVTKYFKQDEELDKMVAACMANPITPLSHDLFPAEFESGEETRRKPSIATRPCGKGKDIRILGQLLEVEMHSKTFYGYHPKQQPVKVVEVDVNNRKSDDDLKSKGDMNKKAALDHKRKAEVELRLEGKVTRRCGKGKNLDEAGIKAILGETKEFVEKKDKKRIHSDCEPVHKKDMTKLDFMNRPAADKRKTDPTNQLESGDYDLKLEASTQKLREAYQRDGDAKQKKQIQLVDFHIVPMKKQPRCNAKTRGKPSLRQRLMAMETRKCNKKFAPFSSCPLRKTMFV